MFNFFIRKNTNSDAILKKANNLYIKKKYASAIKYYAKILAVDSTNFPATANTAMAYFEMQKFAESIPFFKKTLTMDSYNPWWYNYLSQSMQKNGNLIEALDNAWNAVLLGENDNAHHLNFAYTIYEISVETGRDKIDSYLKKWYEKYPQNPVAEQCYKSFFYDKNFIASNKKYVEELFDAFASDFDDVLKNLNYDSPKLIAKNLSEYFNEKKHENLSFLDLGCGSGLCGKELKKIFKKSSIIGVDISSQMLAKAKDKNVYNKLVKDDITTCFCNDNMVFDVVMAADVLTYFGKLDSVLKKVDSLICKNGVFIFTVSENNINSDEYFLTPSSRFVHSIKYIEKMLKKYGFSIVKKEHKILRKEGDNEVKGYVFLVVKK